MMRCKKCILPSTYTGVTFDENEICSLCKDYGKVSAEESMRRESRTRELEQMVAEARKPRGDYDCLVPVSGGRDSSYVAYVMRKVFGLRVVGVNFDNGYRSELALQNLNIISRALDMDLVTLKVAPELVDRVFAHFLSQAGYFCSACDALGYLVIYTFALREAQRMKTKLLVVGGWSQKHEYQPGLSVLSMKDFGRILERNEHLLTSLKGHPLIDRSVFERFVQLGDIRRALPKPVAPQTDGQPIPKVIQLPDYWEWNYKVIDEALQNALGWKSAGGLDTAHFDCVLSPIPEFLKRRKFGFSQETLRTSVLIREGLIDREKALSELEARETNEVEMPGTLAWALEKWGMTPEQVAWDAEWSR